MKINVKNIVSGCVVALCSAIVLFSGYVEKASADELKWTFEYDAKDRITKVKDPGGRDTRMQYSIDKSGQLREFVRSNEDGSSITGKFDEMGRLSRMIDGAGAVFYGYDNQGRLNRVERKGASAVTYTHDRLDRITSIQVGDFYRIEYGYDFLDRLVLMDTPFGKVTWEHRTGQVEVIRSLPNGVKTFWKRQPNGELQEITHGFFAKPDANRYFILAQYQYGRGPDGRIATLRERSSKGQFVRRYAYDAMGRLTYGSGPGNREHRYDYDPVGNRTIALSSGHPEQAFSYDWAGRLTSVNGTSPRYDASGNLTELTIGGATRQYRHHPDGRLAEVRAGNETVQYRYDGFGRLITRTTTAGETRFIPDPISPYWQPLVIEEPDGVRTLVIWDGPTPLALVRNSEIQWLLHDHLGSVRLVTNAKGGVVRNNDYDPFGAPEKMGQSAVPTPSFASMFWDERAGGYLTLARVFVPELGSFLQPDPLKRVPLGSPGDLTLASYSESDPVNHIDRDGAAREWFDDPAMWTSPNFFSAIIADRNRSIGDQLDDDQLRSRALRGELAYQQVRETEKFQQDLKALRYDPEQLTLFVRKPHLWDFPSGIIPHTGIYFGREMRLGDLHLDGVELKNTRVAGKDGGTVVAPMRLAEAERRGVIHLQPLETDYVQVVYDGRTMPIRDLPSIKKAEIQASFLQRSLSEMGMTRGAYEAVGRGRSNNCVDMPLHLLDQAVQEVGVKFHGGSFRDRFTTRTGNYSAANPTRFFNGLAAHMPRLSDPTHSRQRTDFKSDFDALIANLAVCAVLDVGAELPGRWGDVGLAFKASHETFDVVTEAMDAMNYAKQHPGDPVGDLRFFAASMKAVGLAGSGILAMSAGGIAMNAKFAGWVGSNIRSRVLQNRAEKLTHLGGAVLPPLASFGEDIEFDGGSFTATGVGNSYSFQGGFSLTGSRKGVFGRNRQSTLWANSTVNDLRTARGERITGVSRRSEIRKEAGGSLFNLYEPTSVTVTRHSYDKYRVTHSGAMIMTKEDDDYVIRKTHEARPSSSLGEGGIDGFGNPPPGHGGDGGGSWPPSPVGGVYLGGAGGAIEGLGVLKGVRIDSNGNLVLVGEESGDIKLPPLRLEDVVTVFRSVYLHGEGPTVTINPNPVDPENSDMIIVHSEATKNTYVGWVLYQADRLMKGYGLGVDNITGKDIVSGAPGYADVIDTVYFGAGDRRMAQKEGIWERFWIVPAAARRFEGLCRELTLFDVPLKVKTQKMKWKKDKLVDDLTGKSSPGALKFTSWFTRNYDGISAEQRLLPPPESGIATPVPVFAELRRIALLTAVAEKLRDQGIPMPFWMRDYEVKEAPFEKFTPGREVTRRRKDGNMIRTSRIFGGVEMSAGSKAVKTYAGAADVGEASAEQRDEVERGVKLAARLEQAVESAVPPVGAAPLIVHQVVDNNRAYQAASVPGAKTLALNPGRLDEVDLVVPFGNGREIRVVRSFNSFFDPKGSWGRGWTMNLPTLQKIRIPVRREGSKASYSIAYELLTPLNSFYARFKDIRPVQALGGSRLQVPDAPGPFHGLADARPDFLKNMRTLMLLLKNGQKWHFTKRGDLIAIEDGPQVTIYERDSAGRAPRIIGLLGGVMAARIDLEYSRRGKLAKVVGKSLYLPEQKSVEVSYNYGPSGRLAGVSSGEGRVGYGYSGSRITAVTWTDNMTGAQPETLRTFEYNERGQVVSEKFGARGVRYSIAAAPGGVELSVEQNTDHKRKVFTSFDDQMRPVEANAADGAHTAWNYKEDGRVETTLTAPERPKVTLIDSKDGRQRTITADGAPTLMARFDPGGNLTTLLEEKQVLLSQQWRPDGQLAGANTSEQGISLRYGEHGLLSSVVVHPPGAEKKLAEWREIRLNRRGAPVEITDNTGLAFQLGYDESGVINAASQKTPKGSLGYQLERDGKGRVRALKSSWGNTSYSYTDEGDLQSVENHRGGKVAAVKLSGGLVREVKNFHGGITTFDYYDKGGLTGALRNVTSANGLVLAHQYNTDGRLNAVTVGGDRRVKLEYDSKGRVVTYAWESK